MKNCVLRYFFICLYLTYIIFHELNNKESKTFCLFCIYEYFIISVNIIEANSSSK